MPHGVSWFEHMSFLVIKTATSWWFGCESSRWLRGICHLQNDFSDVSAFIDTFKFGSVEESSIKMILTTTILMLFPIVGSRNREDT